MTAPVKAMTVTQMVAVMILSGWRCFRDCDKWVYIWRDGDGDYIKFPEGEWCRSLTQQFSSGLADSTEGDKEISWPTRSRKDKLGIRALFETLEKQGCL